MENDPGLYVDLAAVRFGRVPNRIIPPALIYRTYNQQIKEAKTCCYNIFSPTSKMAFGT
jgi:hypothetical protein